MNWLHHSPGSLRCDTGVAYGDVLRLELLQEVQRHAYLAKTDRVATGGYRENILFEEHLTPSNTSSTAFLAEYGGQSCLFATDAQPFTRVAAVRHLRVARGQRTLLPILLRLLDCSTTRRASLLIINPMPARPPSRCRTPLRSDSWPLDRLHPRSCFHRSDS
jgi:hypothetical protein